MGVFNKLFFVGFNKTATTSIAHLMNMNGIRCCHWDRGRLVARMLTNLAQDRRVLSGYDKKYKAFADFSFRGTRSWIDGNRFFVELWADYPNSLFVYNSRPSSDWLESRMRHRSGGPSESLLDLHYRLLGTRDSERVGRYWSLIRENMEKELLEFFAPFPDRLLWVSIDDPNFTRNLGDFIGVKLDNKHWECLNKSAEEKG